jgi:hypothetical protein
MNKFVFGFLCFLLGGVTGFALFKIGLVIDFPVFPLKWMWLLPNVPILTVFGWLCINSLAMGIGLTAGLIVAKRIPDRVKRSTAFIGSMFYTMGIIITIYLMIMVRLIT